MERSGLDLMETRRTEVCSNNRQGYGTRGAADHPSRVDGAHGGVGLGSRDRTNEWGSKSTCFYRTNVVICEIVWNVSEVDPGCGVVTMADEVLMVVMVLGSEVPIKHIGINGEDPLGSSLGSFDGMTYDKKTVGSLPENILKGGTDAEIGRSEYGP